MSKNFDLWLIMNHGPARPAQVKVGGLGGVLARLSAPVGPIYVDTETNGLRADSGARVTAVSVAYRRADGSAVSFAVPFDIGWDRTKADAKGTLLPHHRDCPLYPTTEAKRLRTLETRKRQLERASTAKRPNTERIRGLVFEVNALAQIPACGCPVTVNANEQDWLELLAWMHRWAARNGWVGHNAPFDHDKIRVGTRFAGGLPLPEFAWDTLLGNAVMDPTESTGLKPTAKRLFGESNADEQAALKAAMKANPPGWGTRFDLVDWDVQGPYAARDTDLTMRLHEHQLARLDEGDCWPQDRQVTETEVALSNVLTKVMARGLLLDVDGLRAEGDRVRAEADRLAAELPFPATPAGAVGWFFPEGGREPLALTDTGRPKVDRDVVAQLVREGVEYAAEYQRVMALRSLLSKFYDAWAGLVGADGRLRTTFKQVQLEQDFRSGTAGGGTVSGRLSSAEPNLQQTPDSKRIRIDGVTGPKRFFRAKPGHRLIEVDVSGAEARILCWYGRIESMRREVFVAGQNIHDINTRKIFGIEPDHPEWDRLRHLAKTGLFSIVYGAGVRKLAESLKISERECREFKAGVMRAYPEIRRLMTICTDRVERGGALVLAGGRRRPHSYNEASFKAANSLIQGSQAMALRTVIVRIEQEFPGMLVSTVHDSVWLEAPSDQWEAIGARVQQIIREEFERFFSSPEFVVPFESDIKLLATDSEGYG